MYLQFFPIYGFMLGANYWNSDMKEFDVESDEIEHLFQIMIGIVGISFHLWRARS
jgi:hypothetical protein